MTQPTQTTTCSVADCDKPVRCKGLCQTHYSRLQRHGHVEVTRPYRGPADGPCPVEDCDQPQDFNGMCKQHATRVARHGDPHAVTHQRDRNYPRGTGHHNWTGDDASYYAVHQRLVRQRGRAGDQPCADCGAEAKQWSYDRSDPDEQISTEGLPYSTDVDRYVPRCVSCHKAFDLAHQTLALDAVAR